MQAHSDNTISLGIQLTWCMAYMQEDCTIGLATFTLTPYHLVDIINLEIEVSMWRERRVKQGDLLNKLTLLSTVF